MRQRYFKVEKNRGACLVEGLIWTPEGVEPVFVIRASDQFAPRAIREYLNFMHGTSYPDNARRDLVQLANDFQLWQGKHTSHQPDGAVKIQQLSTNEPLEVKIINHHGRQERVLLNDPAAPQHPMQEESAKPAPPPAATAPAPAPAAPQASGFIGEGADAAPPKPAVPASPQAAAPMPRKPAPKSKR